jgi:ubiquinone/menaquinone biosynthesis C-methylase UbiE
LTREVLLEPLLRWLRFRQVIFHIPPGVRLLDVGCGQSAAFLRSLSARIEYGVGVDFKVEAMQRGNIQTMQLKLDQKLPFADSSFHVVTLLAVLEHLDYEALILQEIYRVLKPAGQLILTVPSVWAQPVLEFLSYRLKIVNDCEIRDHKRYYTRLQLEQILIEQMPFKRFEHHYFQLGMNNFCRVEK